VLGSIIHNFHPGFASLWHGAQTGALFWLGFVVTTLVVNHTFQGAKPALTVLDAGHWLGVLMLQGAILGWLGA